MSDVRRFGRVKTAPVLRAMLIGTLAATSAGLFSGCDGARSADDRTMAVGSDIENDPYFQSGLRLVWRAYPQVGDGERPLYFEVLDDALAFQDTANTMSLIEGPSGRIRWTAALGRPLEKFVGAARMDNIVIAASESELQFLDVQNGQLIDRQRLAVLANTRPVILPPVAVVGSSTGEVYAHDLRVGVKVWGVKMHGPIKSPVIKLGGGDVGVVSEGGELIMLKASEGTSGGRRATLFAGVENGLITDGAQMYAAGLDQSVWAYDIGSGRRVWRHRTESALSAQPIVAHGVVVVYAEREGLLGIDARNGKLLWSQADAQGDGVASSATSVTLWDGTTMTVVSLRDGSIRSQVELPGVRWVRSGKDGILYAIGENGVVSKYEPLS